MKKNKFSFNLQAFARRDNADIKYRGRRRWNGSYGRLFWDDELVFEIESYECKVEAQREDVLIGADVDSKITSLKGTGSMRIKSVINRNLQRLLDAWKNGHDPRSIFQAAIDDPDAVDGGREAVTIDNVWFNDLDLLSFEKGKVVEKEYTFGFTPSDATFTETIDG